MQNLIELPLELLNEPYTDTDNGYRPEIVVRRRKYYYSDPYSSKKQSTKLSILNIYDTYGLGITLLFLDHLEQNYHPSRLYVYIQDACVLLGCDRDEVPDSLADQLAFIRDELTRRAEMWPKITGPDCTVSMPIELVAKITGSERISHEVTKHVWINRHIVPSPELIVAEIYDSWSVFKYANGLYTYCSTYSHLQLEKKDNKYVLTDLGVDYMPCVSEGDNGEPEIVGCSLSSYYLWFNSIGCKPDKQMKLLLDSLRDKFQVLNESNVEQACAWLLSLTDIHIQLSKADSDRLVTEEELTMDELRDNILLLIAEARHFPFQNLLVD
ncbi:Hypothetical protein POVR2_LOCUS132 [uncultured virus]|nr:Hypothetical protein POVR2_LOCUS132 [uncultured virus]